MMRGPLAVLSQNWDIYFDPSYTKIDYISLNSQKKELCQCFAYITIGKEVTKRGGKELENLIFNFCFWN